MTSLLESLIAVIAPHRCIDCSKENNEVLCRNCLLMQTETALACCFGCQKPTSDFAICTKCRLLLPFEYAWIAGEYENNLKELIKRYKFASTPAAAIPLARLLYEMLPVLPQDCIIVPVPTISAHIRQRGFDHTLLLAKELSKLTRRKIGLCLQRTSQQRQLGATRSQRAAQAKHAFVAKKVIAHHVLLIDDVVTTGATICAAAKALQKVGVPKIWVAAVARQAPGK